MVGFRPFFLEVARMSSASTKKPKRLGRVLWSRTRNRRSPDLLWPWDVANHGDYGRALQLTAEILNPSRNFHTAPSFNTTSGWLIWLMIIRIWPDSRCRRRSPQTFTCPMRAARDRLWRKVSKASQALAKK